MSYLKNNAPKYLRRAEITGSFFTNDISRGAKAIGIGDEITFKRENYNAYDVHAVAAYNDRGIKIGYVSKKENAAIAHIMDSGKAECYGNIVYVNFKRSSVGMLADIFYVCEKEDEAEIADIIQQYQH